MVFTNYSKSQKFEDKSCLLVFEESSIGTLVIPYCKMGQTRTQLVMNTEILLTSLMSKPIDAGLMAGAGAGFV